MLKAKPIRSKKCANPECKKPFKPNRAFVSWCGTECAIVIARLKQAKKQRQEAAQDRAEHAKAKEAIKGRSWYMKSAEKAVRDYRRNYELSIGSGCISCGKSQAEVQAAHGWKTGGAWDAGHWMGKGARPELRLLEINIWLQCKGCNGGSSKYPRKGESVATGFLAGLIERIGLEAVEALKADQEPRRYTIEDLKQIAKEYRAKLRELKSRQKD